MSVAWLVQELATCLSTAHDQHIPECSRVAHGILHTVLHCFVIVR